MAKLVTLLEQHLDRQPPTVAVQATTGGRQYSHVSSYRSVVWKHSYMSKYVVCEYYTA